MTTGRRTRYNESAFCLSQRSRRASGLILALASLCCTMFHTSRSRVRRQTAAHRRERQHSYCIAMSRRIAVQTSHYTTPASTWTLTGSLSPPCKERPQQHSPSVSASQAGPESCSSATRECTASGTAQHTHLRLRGDVVVEEVAVESSLEHTTDDNDRVPVSAMPRVATHELSHKLARLLERQRCGWKLAAIGGWMAGWLAAAHPSVNLR